jgi:hypothetical protein
MLSARLSVLFCSCRLAIVRFEPSCLTGVFLEKSFVRKSSFVVVIVVEIDRRVRTLEDCVPAGVKMSKVVPFLLPDFHPQASHTECVRNRDFVGSSDGYVSCSTQE